MTRTSAADINRLSCSANVWGWDEGSDHATAAEPPPAIGLNLRPTGPTHYSSYLKLCDGTTCVHITGAVIEQGLENAMDLNARASDILVMAEFGSTGMTGDQVITVKGGCSKITVAGTIYSKGRNADVVIGAWSDQCLDQSFDLDFSALKRADGQPVTFILARCHDVKLPDGADVLMLKSWGYSAYWWLKRAAVKLGLFGGGK